MKKIALLVPNLENPGGINIVVKFLGKGFEKADFEVHYFPVGKTKIKDSEFIHPVNSDNKKVQLIGLKKQIEKFPCDYYVANNLRTNFLLSTLNIKNSFHVFHEGKVLENKNFKKKYSYIKPKSVSIVPNPFDFDLIKAYRWSFKRRFRKVGRIFKFRG